MLRCDRSRVADGRQAYAAVGSRRATVARSAARVACGAAAAGPGRRRAIAARDRITKRRRMPEVCLLWGFHASYFQRRLHGTPLKFAFTLLALSFTYFISTIC